MIPLTFGLTLQNKIILIINKLSIRVQSENYLEKELEGLDVLYDKDSRECGWTSQDGKSIVLKIGKNYCGQGNIKIVSCNGRKGECLMDEFVESKFLSLKQMINEFC